MPVYPSSSPAPAAQAAADYHAILRKHVYRQEANIARYHLDQETVWIKRAGPGNPAWRYRLLGTTSRLLKLAVLSPVFNPGGAASVEIEVRRLQDFRQRGLRVPEVLAHCADGFVMRHLGAAGEEAPSLGNQMEQTEDTERILSLWCQGLEAIYQVHAQGTCLSQAFARNLVRCPDGVIGYIDFEDDPAASLPMPLCQSRDALCYTHSTAWILERAGALEEARPIWQAWLKTLLPETQQVLAQSVDRLSWAGRLPASRRLGRDAQRIRFAFELLRRPSKFA